MTRIYAACREQDKHGHWIVVAVINNTWNAEKGEYHPLPTNYHCIPAPANYKHGDINPGDIWDEKQGKFRRPSLSVA